MHLLQAMRRDRDFELHSCVVAAKNEVALRFAIVGGPIRLQQEPIEREFQFVRARHVLMGLDLNRYELAAALVHGIRDAANLQL